MARNPQVEKLEKLYHTVKQHPGERPGLIARMLGVHRSQVTRSLPAFEEHGYLLSEDETGGLWPYRSEKS